MEKWEYKIIPIVTKGWLSAKVEPCKLEEHLSSLGKEGWELVDILPLTEQSGWGSRTGEVFNSQKKSCVKQTKVGTFNYID